MPAADVRIDDALVRRLLASQFPAWATLPVEALGQVGWDNAIYRLGRDLVVRLPRREVAAGLVDHEHRWLPELAPHLPLPVPVPVGKGEPAEGYPWRWSVCPWLPGEMATTSPPDDMERFARDLGAFVAALHRPAPADAPRNPWRGVPLADRDGTLRSALRRLGAGVDAGAVLAAWARAVVVPPWPGPPVWLHGDLHPANVLVDGGRASAVIDFGDMTAGDPAVDLIAAWMFLPAGARDTFRAASAADDDTWARARGWALAIGVSALASSSDNPVIAGLARRGIDAVLAEVS